jgi:hypothetical protein
MILAWVMTGELGARDLHTIRPDIQTKQVEAEGRSARKEEQDVAETSSKEGRELTPETRSASSRTCLLGSSRLEVDAMLTSRDYCCWVEMSEGGQGMMPFGL